MKVSELIELLRQATPDMTVMAKVPRLVFVDNHDKPGCWNETPNLICKIQAVLIG